MTWYCAQTHANAEEKARFNLLAQGYEVYLPQLMKRRAHARKVSWEPRPLFPRYIFVGNAETATAWGPIGSTFGVSSLVRFGDTPAPVPEWVIAELKRSEGKDGIIPIRNRVAFVPGQRVEICDGALSGQIAIFDKTADNERVFVLLNLLSRQMRVRLPAAAISVPA